LAGTGKFSQVGKAGSVFSVGRLLGSWVWWGLGAVGTAESGFLEQGKVKGLAQGTAEEGRGEVEEGARFTARRHGEVEIAGVPRGIVPLGYTDGISQWDTSFNANFRILKWRYVSTIFHAIF